MIRTTDDEPKYRCGVCLDEASGWIALVCRGTDCERTQSHPPHTFAVRCGCWLSSHSAEILTHAEQAMQKGRPHSASYDALVAFQQGRYLWRDAVTINAAKARQAERRRA